ncbi:WG repeat-containing protein [Sporocytophaga myxococcoides]|uniref:WG repeat-containing protein n=1 Tax=Sporocytophaga myxococcoides TaxID=153721 RepID=UPI000415B8A4|nr:WG repeat-containing protein [Sporocytophaga myxococcoides]
MNLIKPFLFLLCSLISQAMVLAGSGDSLITVQREKLDLNKKGQFLLPKETILQLYNDFTPIKVISPSDAEQIGFVDKKGKFVIAPAYHVLVESFQNGCAIVGNYEGSKVIKGVIDENGKVVAPLKYDSIARISKAVFACNLGGYFDFYNAGGIRLNVEKLSDFKIEGNLVSGTNIEAEQGVFDLNGKLLLPFQQKHINIKESGIEGKKYPVWEIMEDGKVLFTIRADSLQAFQLGFNRFFRNEYVGILKGKEVIAPPVYADIQILEPRYFIVKREKLFGLIDSSGKVILPAIFDSIEKTKYASLLKLYSKDGESVFNKDSKQVIFRNEKAIHVLDSISFAVKNKNDKWGVVDLNGYTIIPFEYDSIGYKRGDLFEAGMKFIDKPEMGVIDSDQQWVICKGELDLFNIGLIEANEEKDSSGTLKRKTICNLNPYKFASYEKFPNGFIKVTNYKGQIGLINSKGKEIAEPIYDSLATVSDTLDLFFLRKGKNIGLIDGSGVFVFSFKDDVTEIRPFEDGHAAFKKKGLYGFIDLNGNIRVAPKYPKYQNFSDGYAAVVLLGKWGFVDKNENIAVQPYYPQVRPMRKGVARVSTGANKWKFIDSTGKDINGNVYNEIAVCGKGRYNVFKNGKVGLADVNGKELIVPRYDQLKDYENGIIEVKKDGKAGFIDESGNFTIPLEYEDVAYDKINNRYFLQPKPEEKTSMEFTSDKK